MLEGIVSTLLVAAVGAVVLVAYRHPEAFAKLYASFRRLLGYAALVTFAMMVGDGTGREAVRSAIRSTDLVTDDVRKKLAALAPDNSHYLWALGGLLAIYVFLEALSALPRLGIVDQKVRVDASKTDSTTHNAD